MARGGTIANALEKNRPRQRITAPVRSRHALAGIGPRSRVKKANSIALPDVDMVRDTELIRQGHGESLGNARWRINGRTYVREDTPAGTLYPESGPGIVTLSRAQFRALGILAKYNGYTDEAAHELGRNPEIDDRAVEMARGLYALRTRKP